MEVDAATTQERKAKKGLQWKPQEGRMLLPLPHARSYKERLPKEESDLQRQTLWEEERPQRRGQISHHRRIWRRRRGYLWIGLQDPRAWWWQAQQGLSEYAEWIRFLDTSRLAVAAWVTHQVVSKWNALKIKLVLSTTWKTEEALINSRAMECFLDHRTVS